MGMDASIRDTRKQASGLADLVAAATRIRRRCLEMTSAAGSGHATSSLSAADLVSALFFHALRYEVATPDDPRNDRFVLSKGHGAPLLYAAWAEAGAIPVEKLLTLRRFGSELEGHPTPRFPWADVATGALGQGLSVGLGMALAGRLDGGTDRRSDRRVWVLLGDGETAEGSVWEAAALAGHLGADNLTAIVDVNRLGQTGPTALGHDLGAYARRFAAFGWHPIEIDGHDMAQIVAAYDEAKALESQPTAILARTLKGRGVSFLEDAEGWHGKAVDPGEDLERALGELEAPEDAPPLAVRPPVEREAVETIGGGPTLELPAPAYERGDAEATRTAFGTALAKLGELDPRVVVLDGDVQDSTRTFKFREAHPERFVEGYIAEQNMVGMAMGLQALGRIPVAASFACFLTRAFDFVRLAGISGAHLVLCGSHAGVSIGEDGPSQMGLEDLAMMRAIPGSLVLQPADAVSAERAVELAARHQGIAYIRTLRPKTPVLYAGDETFEPGGCRVWHAGPEDRLAIAATGITVHEALAARERLAAEGLPVRVLDCYSIKPAPVEALRRAARETGRPLLVVEDHYAAGGLGEAVLSALADTEARVEHMAVRDVPTSGPSGELLAAAGIDADSIAARARLLAG